MVDVSSYLDRSPLTLELGCGGTKRDLSAVGVDLRAGLGVDIVADALEALRAFPDGSVDAIFSEHFLEHVDQPRLILAEAERVLRPHGEFRAKVPHFSNPWFYSDPTHHSFFGLYTPCYWVAAHPFKRQVPQYETPLDFELISARHVFKSSPPFVARHVLKKVLSSWVTLSVWTQELYEEFFTHALPCYELDYRLRKVSPS